MRTWRRKEGCSRVLGVSIGVALGLAAVGVCRGEDWPQFSGPNGDFTADCKGLADQWPEGGPKVAWEARIGGGGFSSPIIAGGKVFLVAREIEGDLKGWNGQKVKAGAPDILYALDFQTGKELWKHEIPLLMTNFVDATAWCTPVTDGQMVYAQGGDGAIHCVNAGDGKLVWQWPKPGEAPVKEVSGRKWGRVAGAGSATPLILCKDVLVFVGYASGGSRLFTAADRKTGEIRWECEAGVGDGGWYPASTPVVKAVGGQETVFIWGNAIGVATGKVDRSPVLIKWIAGHQGDSFVTSFERNVDVPTNQVEQEKKLYGQRFNMEGGLALRTPELDAEGKLGAKTVWEWKKRGGVDLTYGGQLLTKDAVFVFLGINEGKRMACLKRDTGEELWQAQIRHGLGYANAILADNKLIYAWGGTLNMVAADPKGYRELASCQASEGSWATPALADGFVVVRGDAGTVKCLDLRAGIAPKSAAAAAAPSVDDWPAAEGPLGDFSTSFAGLLDRFPEAPANTNTPNAPREFIPKVLWESRTDPGIAAPLIAGGKIILLSQKEWGMRKDAKGELQKDKDGKPQYDAWGGWRSGVGPLVLNCLNLGDGKELWRYEFKVPVPNTNKPPQKFAGPYIAPVVDSGRVYALGGAQELVCLNVADGKPAWTLAGDVLGGVTEKADAVVASAGRVFCAGEFGGGTRISTVDKGSGRFLWSKTLTTPNWQNRNTTPRVLRVDKRELVQVTGFESLATFDEDGAILATYRDSDQLWNYDPTKCFFSGNRLFLNRQWVTEAFDLAPAAGGMMSCKKVWSREEGPNQSMIALGGRLFFLAGDRRTIKARDAATGKPIWEAQVDRGQFVGGIGADNKIIILNAPNEIIVAKADSAQYEELTRGKVPGLETCWSAPAFSKGQVIVRDCTGQVKCVDLRKP